MLTVSVIGFERERERERAIAYRRRREREREREMDRFSQLPRACFSEILARTSPRDACRTAAVSRGVKDAADSDDVWIKFLPSDCAEIVSRAQPPLDVRTYKHLCGLGARRSPGDALSYKHLYLCLFYGHVLLDGGKLSLSIDRDSGKKHYMLGARELTIEGASSPDIWTWKSADDTRFSERPTLLQGCWRFEILCKIKPGMLSPDTSYVAFFVFKFEEENFFFGSLPISVSLKSIREMGDEGVDGKTSTIYLKPTRPEINGKIPRERKGGWLEVELGEFSVSPDDNRQVQIRMFEAGDPPLKLGLVVEGIELRPKAIKRKLTSKRMSSSHARMQELLIKELFFGGRNDRIVHLEERIARASES